MHRAIDIRASLILTPLLLKKFANSLSLNFVPACSSSFQPSRPLGEYSLGSAHSMSNTERKYSSDHVPDTGIHQEYEVSPYNPSVAPERKGFAKFYYQPLVQVVMLGIVLFMWALVSLLRPVADVN
jgi:hypothetical protein